MVCRHMTILSPSQVHMTAKSQARAGMPEYLAQEARWVSVTVDGQWLAGAPAMQRTR